MVIGGDTKPIHQGNLQGGKWEAGPLNGKTPSTKTIMANPSEVTSLLQPPTGDQATLMPDSPQVNDLRTYWYLSEDAEVNLNVGEIQKA